jgi:hypothetical protein
MTAPHGSALAGSRHLELPVTDPGRPRWYRTRCGCGIEHAFAGRGLLTADAVSHPRGVPRLAPRPRPERARAVTGTGCTWPGVPGNAAHGSPPVLLTAPAGTRAGAGDPDGHDIRLRAAGQ